MRDRVLGLVRNSNITRSWVGLVTASEEILAAQRTLEEASSQVSLIDKINVFTDSPEEAQVKDAKQRIKARTTDRERYQKEVALFLNSVGEQIEHFSFATKLESVLYRASQVMEPKGCGNLVKELRNWLLETMPTPPGDRSVDPEQALDALGGPLAHSVKALWMLTAVLSQARFETELRWGVPVNVLRYRPLILTLVEQCYQAFKQDCPELPMPCDIFHTIGPSVSNKVESTPTQQALGSSLDKLFQDRLPKLLDVCRRLAAVQFLMEVNKKGISTLDRVVFWSDTKAEALEKELKEKLGELEIQMEMEWQSLTSENLAFREGIWGAFLLDRGSHINTLILKITATRPSGIINKTCEVAYREEPVLEVDRLRRAVVEKYPLMMGLEQLQIAASTCDLNPDLQTESPGRPQPAPALLSTDELVKAIARELRHSDFAHNRAEADRLESEVADSRARRRDEMRGAGFLKQVSMVAGRTSSYRDQLDAQRQAESLNEQAERTFFEALNRAHSPTAIGLTLTELGGHLAAITAYVGETRVTDSDGNTSTEYFGALKGMKPVYEMSEILNQLILEQSEGLSYPLESLESHAFGAAAALLKAQPLRF